MNKKLSLVVICVLLCISAVIWKTNQPKTADIEAQRAQHQKFLDNSPFAKTVSLTKEERKAFGLPPNAYNEMQWQRTMDPATGRPMYNRANDIQRDLAKSRSENQTRGVGGDANNPWIERGPTHAFLEDYGFGEVGPVGGRTRAIMFDPNDSNNERVFAGGISGGLWVNQDITDATSTWSLVTGLPSNVAVKNIIYDPNNTNTMYIGSGESYTSGACIGNGIWKSTDGGTTWANILGGYTGTSIPGGSGFDQIIDGIFYVNDIVARDMGSTTELYAAVAHAFFVDGFTDVQSQWHGYFQHGVYKSTDNGSSWTNISVSGGIIDSAGLASNPNDLEIDLNNNVWVSTTNNLQLGSDTGGKIFRSLDGTTFTLMNTFSSTARTEIEVSQTNADELWVLTRSFTGSQRLPFMYHTTDAFTNTVAISTPVDADTATIPSNDFTRGQSFYDLEIEADANGNLYVGGIDLFRSTNNGSSWSQLSEWYNIPSLTSSIVHADQHAIVFRPGNDNQAVFGTDGGVYYSSDLTNAVGNTNGLEQRNLGYSTLQFYYGALDELGAADGDDFIGGTQDNGSPYVLNAAAGKNVFSDFFGGDGAYAEIDAADGYAIQSYQNNRHRYVPYPSLDISQDYQISSGSGGSFINEAELDKNLNILYVNRSISGTPVIERISNFTFGSGAVLRFNIVNISFFNQPPSALKVSPFTTSSTTLFIGQINGKLLRLDNADTIGNQPTFVDITGDNFLGTISDIEFGANEDELFVTMSNYGVESIWYTEDGGINWSAVEGNLPDIPVNCILQNPLVPEQLIVGTAFGVWATEDFTDTDPEWVQAYNGMIDVPVTDLDLRPSDNLILASTYGRGMFTSQFTSNESLSASEFNEPEDTVKIVPTISNGTFQIFGTNKLGQAIISMYNISGQEVFKEGHNFITGSKEVSLNLTPGVYLLKIKYSEGSLTERLIIE